MPASDTSERPRIADLRAWFATRYVSGRPEDYDRDHAGIDQAGRVPEGDATGRTRSRLEADGEAGTVLVTSSGEVAKRGIIDVLRKGVRRAVRSNCSAALRGAQGRQRRRLFSVTRRPTARMRLQLALTGAVYQRPADCHVRAEEPPDETDRGRRHPAVQAGPRPAGTALPVGVMVHFAGRPGSADVRTCKASTRGSCHSTRALTTAGTRPTPAG